MAENDFEDMELGGDDTAEALEGEDGSEEEYVDWGEVIAGLLQQTLVSLNRIADAQERIAARAEEG